MTWGACFKQLAGAAAAAVAAVGLAFLSEALAYQHGIVRITPGQLVSRHFVSPTGLAALGKSLKLELAVDTALWWLLICVVGLLWLRRSRKVQIRSCGLQRR